MEFYKSKEINTGVTTLMLIDIPKDYKVSDYIRVDTKTIITFDNSKTKESIKSVLPDYYDFIGEYENVRDDEWHEMLDKHDWRHNNDLTANYNYRDYNESIECEDNSEKYPFYDMKDSIESLLNSNEVYTFNKYGLEPRYDYLYPTEYYHDFLEGYERWEKFENKVYNNLLILEKK